MFLAVQSRIRIYVRTHLTRISLEYLFWIGSFLHSRLLFKLSFTNQTQLICFLRKIKFLNGHYYYLVQKMFKRQWLVQILLKDSKTSLLAQQPKMIDQLVEILNRSSTDYLSEFAKYLENDCELTPSQILKISSKFLCHERIYKTLDIKILKLWLLFQIYDTMNIKAIKLEMTAKRNKVQRIFSQFDFQESSLHRLIQDCWKAGEETIQDIDEIIETVVEGREKQIKRLFTKANRNGNNQQNYNKNIQHQFQDFIQDYKIFPKSSFESYLQKQLILAYIEIHHNERGLFQKIFPQVIDFKCQIKHFQRKFQQKYGKISLQISQILEKIKQEIEKQQIYFILCLLKSKIMLINAFEVQRLIHKTKNSQKCVQNKDIVLFIGNTNSGKSTNILKFLGYTLQRGTYKKLSTLVAVQMLQQQHKTFYTSPEAKSCTRYMNGCLIPKSMYPRGIDERKKNLAVADSPGFGDSAGVQVDIANGVGMINALHKAQSIRVVVILTQSSLEENLAGVIKIIKTISDLFYQFKKLLKSTKILFNKFSKENMQQAPKLIKNRIINLNQHQRGNQKLKAFLNQFQVQSQKQQNFVDPLKSDYKQILRKICQMEPITEVVKFKYEFQQSTKTQIERYIQIQQKRVIQSLKDENYEQAKLHLLIIHKLKNILFDYSKSEEIYKKLAWLIKKKSQQLFSNYQMQMNKILRGKGEVKQLNCTSQKIKNIYELFNKMQNCSQLVSEQNLKSLQQVENKKLLSLSKSQDISLITPQIVKAIITFSNIFNSSLKSAVVINLQQKYDEVIRRVQKELKQKHILEIKQIIHKVGILSKLIIEIQGTKTSKISGNKQKNIKDGLNKLAQDGFTQIQIFKNNQKKKLGADAINSLKAKIEIINQIIQLNHLDKNTQMKKRIQKELKIIEAKCKIKIFQLSKLKILFDEVGSLIFEKDELVNKKKQIQQLMKISDFSNKFKDLYEHSLQSIAQKHKQNSLILTRYIQELKSNKKSQMYKNMDMIQKSTFIFMQCCKIIDQQKSGKQKINLIKQAFAKHIQGETQQLPLLELRLSKMNEEKFKKIELFYFKLIAYQKMEILGKQITQKVNKLKGQFYQKINLPIQEYLQQLQNFEEKQNNYKNFCYTLQKLQKLSFFLFKVQENFNEKSQQSISKNMKLLLGKINIICKLVSTDAIQFIKSQKSFKNQPLYSKQLVKILLDIFYKPLACQFLSKKVKFEAEQHLSNIKSRLLQLSNKLEIQLKNSQKKVSQLEELLLSCAFYAQIQQKFKQKLDSDSLGFQQLLKKYQQKYIGLLKSQQQIVKRILKNKPSNIKFKDLKPYYDRFCTLKNQQGISKKNLIIIQLRSLQEKYNDDLIRLNQQIQDPSFINNKEKANQLIDAYKQLLLLYKELNNLYNAQDKKNIRTQPSNIKEASNQIKNYFNYQIQNLISLLKQQNITSVNANLRVFKMLQKKVIEILNLQEPDTKMAKQPQKLLMFEEVFKKNTAFLRQKIGAHLHIKAKDKQNAIKQEKISCLIHTLNEAVLTQMKSKYDKDSTNYCIDEGFIRYFAYANNETRKILEDNVERFFNYHFNSYKQRYNISSDQADKIKLVIDQSIRNLPKQIIRNYKDSFLILQRELNQTNQHLIRKTGENIKKDPKLLKDFIKEIKKSFQNNYIDFHKKCIQKFSQIYQELSEKYTKISQKIKFLQDYFLTVYRENKQYFQKDKKFLQILILKFNHQLKQLKQQRDKKITEVKVLFHNFNSERRKISSFQSQFEDYFTMYHFFLQIKDIWVAEETNHLKNSFIVSFEENLNECIEIYNQNIGKKPEHKLQSEQTLNLKSKNSIKNYVGGLRQINFLIKIIKAQLTKTQQLQIKLNINPKLSTKIAKIAQSQQYIQSYQKQFQEMRDFLRNFDFYGDIKRNMSPQQLQQDLQKFNRFYKILEEKQQQFVQLLAQPSGNKYRQFYFKDVSTKIQNKFNDSVQDALEEVRQIFKKIEGQPSFRINLLVSQLEIMKKKGKLFNFLRPEIIQRQSKALTNLIHQQFDKIKAKCQKIFKQGSGIFNDISEQLTLLNKAEKQQKIEKEKLFADESAMKKSQYQKRKNKEIQVQVDPNQKQKLRNDLVLQISSIQNEIMSKKNQIISQLQQSMRKKREQLNKTLEDIIKQLSHSLIIYQKALIDIIYNVDKYKKSFQDIIARIQKFSSNFLSIVQNRLNESQDSRSIGKHILANNKEFFGFNIEIVNNLIKGQGIKYVLQNISKIQLRGRQKMSANQLKTIQQSYQIFKAKYQSYKSKYGKESNKKTINYILDQVKMASNQIKNAYQIKQFQKIHLLSGIFAIWAILKAQELCGRVKFTIEPHPTQITTLLLLLGICNPHESELSNRLAQVGTGEGKSIILAGLCSYLAIIGFKVKCACYSKYLSKRDQQNFKDLFQKLGVENKISYGTFNELCENILNSENLKEKIKDSITSQNGVISKIFSFFVKDKIQISKKNMINPNQTVLVIDQVDVFFEDNFFGKTYCPAISLKGEEVTKVLEFVWKLVKDKADRSRPQQVIKSQVFQNLVNKYPNLSNVLQNQVHGMIAGALNHKHDYLIVQNEIVYKDGDAISRKINYGYATVFANIYQSSNGRVSHNNLEKSQQISLKIAQFSYAKLPQYFQNIIGVTGTLEVLPQFKKKIKEQYAIPSAFGINKKRIEQYKIVPKSSHEEAVVQKINQITDNRPIIIFFKGPSEISQFSSSPHYRQFMRRTNNLTQCHDQLTRDSRIVTAVNPSNITLMSSVFGRGTDFILLDERIKSKGGLHIIQAFLSLDQSQEVQIKGRTARQNSQGSYDCILSQNWLEELDIQRNQIKKDSSQDIHTMLFKAREEKIQKLAETTLKMLNEADRMHEQVFKIFTLSELPQKRLLQHIYKINKYPLLKKTVIKTILCLDATGSMSRALQKTCEIIGNAFERLYSVLNAQNAQVTIQVKIKIYRNYNCSYKQILQSTAFQTTPDNLKQFLERVTPRGGLGNEALEVLFQSLNKEDKLSQVILIGDAPPNTKAQVVSKRRDNRGQSYWTINGFPQTHIDNQISIFKVKRCPVHSFYLNDGTGFNQISANTGGKASKFQINSSQVSKNLAKFIEENILLIAQKETGIQTLVKTYRKMYD